MRAMPQPNARPRFALARKRANLLLEAVGAGGPPTPLEQIARSIGAAVRYQPFQGELSGVAHREKGREGIIGVNSLHAKTRQRFTIAHEIGHLVMHESEDLHVDERFPIGFRNELSGLAVSPSEIEANQFAAELLMPLAWIAEDVRTLHIDFESEAAIVTLAKRYDVSVQAMTIRLSSLGILAHSS